MITTTSAACGIDMEKFRLRRFVERLIDLGEVEVQDARVPLARQAAMILASKADMAVLNGRGWNSAAQHT